MFRLTKDEYDNLRSQFAISKDGKGGRRYLPFAFTEHGVVMLSSVLNSKIANQIKGINTTGQALHAAWWRLSVASHGVLNPSFPHSQPCPCKHGHGLAPFVNKYSGGQGFYRNEALHSQAYS